MATSREPKGDLMMGQLMQENELLSKGPTVLSCGGIYIPHREENQKILYHIITTSNRHEPVKVMTGARPFNVLRDVLLKESLN